VSPLIKRALAHASALALSVGVAVGTPTGAVAADPNPAELAAGWLNDQLTAGVIHNDQYMFDDYGLSIDTALALDALGNSDTPVGVVSDALALHVEDYITGGSFAPDDRYAGATAKSLVLAQLAGDDPTAFGGVNLVGRLNKRVSGESAIKGRIEDKSSTDYANVIGQAFAVQGLTIAGSPKAPSATWFLLKQQCSKGYFRLNFTKNKTTTKQTCDSGNPDTNSAPDTDATALAVLALKASQSTKPAVLTAISDATKWMKARQKSNGSFGGGTSTEGSNSNSTGLAAWALGETGSCGAASKAAAWVLEREIPLVIDPPLNTELGAIAYTRADLVAAQADGITVETRDQWRRTTAQAAPSLLFLVRADCQAR
jgi:hypothetical protein